MRRLAEAAGLKSVAFVADVERGFRNPSAEVLAALAEALNQPLDALRRYDLRPPVTELRQLTAKNADWALALRKLVDAAQSRQLTPEGLIRLLEKPGGPATRAPRGTPRTTPVTPPLFEP